MIARLHGIWRGRRAEARLPQATAESLKHEKHLFHGQAGLYATAADPTKLLVERTEILISREHGTWVAEHNRSDQREQA